MKNITFKITYSTILFNQTAKKLESYRWGQRQRDTTLYIHIGGDNNTDV